MKTSELMIGDWVLYGQRFAIIKELYNGYVTILCSINGQNEYVEETYDNIEPIPLTSEILEKNGWKDISFDSEADYYNDDVEMISFYEAKDGNAWWWHVGLELAAPINYVHELQHILRFFKIGKEVEI